MSIFGQLDEALLDFERRNEDDFYPDTVAYEYDQNSTVAGRLVQTKAGGTVQCRIYDPSRLPLDTAAAAWISSPRYIADSLLLELTPDDDTRLPLGSRFTWNGELMVVQGEAFPEPLTGHPIYTIERRR